jgi:hypothetical protein
MLDPNPDIRGQGEWLLEERGVEIGKFPSDLVRVVKAQNADYRLHAWPRAKDNDTD